MESLSFIADQNRKGASRPSEWVERSLKRIQTHDPHLKSFISVTEESARVRAKQIESEWSQWKDRKLVGVPIAIKDNMLCRGTKTTCGSRMLENFIAPETATVVERLEAEGAIVVGKLNMDEFAMGSSNENSAFGPVKNPWNVETVPGGSSGGSAAAIAAGFVAGALGSDTGGSIRQPAALCGITGLKPTYGRVSRYGLVAFASSLDQIGPMTRTIEDSALMLEVIAGVDPRDSTSTTRPVPEYTKLIEKTKQSGFRSMKIGLPRECFQKGGMDPAVEKSVMEAIDHLKRLGHSIVDVELPHVGLGIAVYYIIATSEASSNLARFDGVKYGYRSTGHTHLRDMYERTRAEGFGPEVKMRIMLGNFCLSSGYYDAYYKKASQVRTLLAKDYADAFSKCDVILTPTTPGTAFRFGEKTADPLKMYLSDVYTVTLNMVGLPGVSIPCGFSPEGMPIGFQFVAPSFQEQILFDIGAHYQSTTKHHLKPSPFAQKVLS